MKIPAGISRVAHQVMEALTPNKAAIKEYGADGWLVRKILPKAWVGKVITTRTVRVVQNHEMTSLSSATKLPAFTKDQQKNLEFSADDFILSLLNGFEHPNDCGKYGQQLCIADQLCGLISTLDGCCKAFTITDEQMNRLIETQISKAMGRLGKKQQRLVLQELGNGKLKDVVISIRTQAAHNPENQKLQLLQKAADAANSGLMKHKSARKVATNLTDRLETSYRALAGGVPGILPSAFIMNLEKRVNTWAIRLEESRLPATFATPVPSPMESRAKQALDIFTPSGNNPQENLEATIISYLGAIKAGNKDTMVVGCQCLYRDIVQCLPKDKRNGLSNDDAANMISTALEKALVTLPETERAELRKAIQTSELPRISATLMTCMHWYPNQIRDMGSYTPSAVICSSPILSEFAGQLDETDPTGAKFAQLSNDIAATTFEGGSAAEDISISEANQVMKLLAATSKIM